MFDAVESELIIKLLRAVSASTVGTPHDAWLRYIQTNSGINKASHNDHEKAFFTLKGGSGKTLHDVLDSYLNTKGYSGSYRDKLHKFCNAAVSF